MSAIQNLRADALSLFQAGIAAADPYQAVAQALRDNPLEITATGRAHIVAFGKAALPMSLAAIASIPAGRRAQVLAVTNYENVRPTPGVEVLGAGHPLPDENGLAAGRRVRALLEGLEADECVLALVSGGASALLVCPVDGIGLAEKIALTDQLLGCGADITEINAVRRRLSVLKGGGFVSLAAPASVRGLILSDVPGDVLSVIASGPTIPPSAGGLDAMSVLAKYQLLDQLPAAVRGILSAPSDGADPSSDPPINQLVGSNTLSVEAVRTAAQDAGYHVHLLCDWLDGDVDDAANKIVDVLQLSIGRSTQKTALICGGETTVRLTGSGRGGRNQELALRVAMLAGSRRISGDWVCLSGGTDGRDGPTDAAGGLVDPRTIERLESKGGDSLLLLANNDSYAALSLAGDLLQTGATGTNVADLQICLFH